MSHVLVNFDLLLIGIAIGYIIGIVFEKIQYKLRNKDPLYSCELYRNVGCADVDGFLCHFPNCDQLLEYKIEIISKQKEALN